MYLEGILFGGPGFRMAWGACVRTVLVDIDIGWSLFTIYCAVVYLTKENSRDVPPQRWISVHSTGFLDDAEGAKAERCASVEHFRKCFEMHRVSIFIPPVDS